MRFDPVRLELIKNAIGSVVDEMTLTVVRIAYSSIMRDTMDLSSAFCDRQGRMIAQGLSLPLHLGSIPDAMDFVLQTLGDDIAEGDIIVLNDPYHGGMHLPDIFMFMPVFVDGALFGFTVLVAHHNDMGGRVPGSSAADSTEIYQEGIRLPVVKLYVKGEPNHTLFDLLRLNVRQPEVILGDVHAQYAACRSGLRGMHDLVARYGVDELNAGVRRVAGLQRARRARHHRRHSQRRLPLQPTTSTTTGSISDSRCRLRSRSMSATTN